MTKPFTFGKVGLLAVALLALLSVSCASELTQDRTIIRVPGDRFPGGRVRRSKPHELGNQLLSDVITLVDQTVDGKTVKVPTIFNDVAEASMRLAVEESRISELSTTPSVVNDITLTRYHVTFSRADGRNTPGVDVPYGFDGGLTFTVAARAPQAAGSNRGSTLDEAGATAAKSSGRAAARA